MRNASRGSHGACGAVPTALGAGPKLGSAPRPKARRAVKLRGSGDDAWVVARSVLLGTGGGAAPGTRASARLGPSNRALALLRDRVTSAN